MAVDSNNPKISKELIKAAVVHKSLLGTKKNMMLFLTKTLTDWLIAK
jgi:hypothetical protein